MCIAVFIWQAHPRYPFLLLLNRDEYHNRPTTPLKWWQEGEILGGRDELAGGTWLASDRDGRVAFLTNVREIVQSLPEPKTISRGDLPVRFLEHKTWRIIDIWGESERLPKSWITPVRGKGMGTQYATSYEWDTMGSKKSPKEFAEEMAKEKDMYNGFNLIVADINSKIMVYISNRPKDDTVSIVEVSRGIHVLTNASLDSPWPKAERLRHSFKEEMDKYGEGEVPVEKLVETLMTDTLKDEDRSLLPRIYPPEKEYQLSSVFIEADTPLGCYGTRSTSALTAMVGGQISFYEKYLENQIWKEHKVTYHTQAHD